MTEHEDRENISSNNNWSNGSPRAAAPLIRKVNMKKEKEERERVRKAYSPKGETSQKMVTFRCDLENIEWLNRQVNKGRYINDLIAKDRGA